MSIRKARLEAKQKHITARHKIVTGMVHVAPIKDGFVAAAVSLTTREIRPAFSRPSAATVEATENTACSGEQLRQLAAKDLRAPWWKRLARKVGL